MTNGHTRRGLAATALPPSFLIGGARAQTAAMSTLERVTSSKQLRSRSVYVQKLLKKQKSISHE